MENKLNLTLNIIQTSLLLVLLIFYYESLNIHKEYVNLLEKSNSNVDKTIEISKTLLEIKQLEDLCKDNKYEE